MVTKEDVLNALAEGKDALERLGKFEITWVGQVYFPDGRVSVPLADAPASAISASDNGATILVAGVEVQTADGWEFVRALTEKLPAESRERVLRHQFAVACQRAGAPEQFAHESWEYQDGFPGFRVRGPRGIVTLFPRFAAWKRLEDAGFARIEAQTSGRGTTRQVSTHGFETINGTWERPSSETVSARTRLVALFVGGKRLTEWVVAPDCFDLPYTPPEPPTPTGRVCEEWAEQADALWLRGWSERAANFEAAVGEEIARLRSVAHQ